MPNGPIAVVVPTPGGRFVAETIASVQAQTTPAWSLVLVDDGSQDGTADVLARAAASDSRIHVVTNVDRQGIARARNRGLASIATDSEYVAFLDHDDLWMPNTLEWLKAELDACPDAPAAHGGATIIDEHGAPYPPYQWDPRIHRMGVSREELVSWPLDRPTEFANLVYEDCIVSMGSGLIRRSSLERLGGFDPRAEPADDYDLWVRLCRLGAIAFVNRAVLAYREHPNQAWRRSRLERRRGVAYVRYKIVKSPDNSPEQRRLAVTGFRLRERKHFEQRWTELRVAWMRRDLSKVARHLVGATLRFAAYGLGRPLPV